MDWKEIAKKHNIEVFWVGKEFSSKGAYIPKCDCFPNGAILLRIDLKDYEIPTTAFHEIGHILKGMPLLDKTLKAVKHLKNERKSNHYIIKQKAPDFISCYEDCVEMITPYAFLDYLELPADDENVIVAENELKEYFGFD